MKKTVLITGASSGFGKAAARLFARQGWNVVATMRSVAAGADLRNDPNILVTPLDVQDLASIELAIGDGVGRFGHIDVLVNNAGFGLFGLFETTPREKIREQFEVNVFGVMDATRAILPHFRERKSGVIVNVSSGAGVFGLPMISLYTASKFALEGFSESVAYELQSQGIVVKIVEPGGVAATGFGKRSGSEASQAPEAPASYLDFIAHTGEVFAGLGSARHASADDVAKVIFDAATDGTRQLRYVATSDIEPLVRARRETSEAQYMALMRSRFSADGAI